MNEQVFLKTISPETTEGILLVDKPVGVTSHDVVDWARRVTGVRKIGHTGTLDPLATGLLQVLIGRRYTKLQPTFLHKDKSYTVTFLLGVESETLDVLDVYFTQKMRELPRSWKSIALRRELVKKSISHYEKKASTRWDVVSQITEDQIKNVIASFVGRYTQQVPLFSAVKVQGKKLYEIGRNNFSSEVTIPTKTVDIKELLVIAILRDERKKICAVTFEVCCSSGTYVRALVRDIAASLETIAIVTQLRRTSIGIEEINQAALCPLL